MTTATGDAVHVRDKIYIGGEWVQSAGTGVLEVINATTEQVMGSVPEGTVEDVEDAVAAARTAFESWSQTSIEERADWMQRIAEALGARMDEIAELITQEVGMPVKLSDIIQAGLPATTFGSMPKLLAEIPWEEQVGNSLIVREPVGRGGRDNPVELSASPDRSEGRARDRSGVHRGAQALAGRTLNAALLADMLDEVGLPAGVFNLVTGRGSVIGEALRCTPTWIRSPSPAPQPPGAESARPPPQRSSASRSSSGVSLRTSSSRMPTCRRRSRTAWRSAS